MTAAERQARARAARQQAEEQEQRALRTFRAALTKISDMTSERLRTKADLASALDQIGIVAAEALSQEH